LFPFLKQAAVPFDNKLLLSVENAVRFVKLLSKIVGPLRQLGDFFPSKNFKGWVQVGKPKGKQDRQKVILIRKQDLNLHKYDTRNKNLVKMLGQSEDFIDELDLELMKKR